MQFFLFVILFFVVLFLIKRSKGSFGKGPPGPLAFPVIGNLVHIALINWTKVYASLAKLSEYYGPVMTIWFGQRRVVVLSDPTIIHEVFKRDEWNFRSGDKFAKMKAGNKGVFGIIQTDGELWRTTRRFCLRHLKNSGFNTSQMEESILQDVTDLCDWLSSIPKGKPLEVEECFGPSMVSTLWKMVTGDRVEVEDKKIAYFQNIVADTLRKRPIGGGIFWSFPILGFMFPKLSGFEEQVRNYGEIRSHMMETIKDHKTTREGGKPRDFIDAYLDEMEGNPDDPNFSEEQLVMTCADLFIAGSDTTTSTFRWALLMLCLHPEIQESLYKELSRIDGIVTLQDKDELILLEAFIMEIHRYASIAPILTPHALSKTVTYKDYEIPQGTLVFVNAWGIHHDEKYWGDPFNFRPSRFLNKDGTGVSNENSERLIPFGSGKRRCPGEPLAKSVLFLMLANIIRNFEFSLVPEDKVPSTEPVNGLSLSPQPFRLLIEKRPMDIQ